MKKQYKIGDFSKHMGVTPDFLKHYEQYGLIQPYINDSGYRYYHFEQAAETLECIKLRNWEFPLKEIKSLVQEASLNEILDSYRSKIHEMQEMITFYQSVVDEFHRFETWLTEAQETPWTIEMMDTTVFLPHSNNRDFIHDANLDKIMEQWMQWMPMVHSTQRINDAFDESKEPYYHWGYSVLKSFADKVGLIQSEPCQIIRKKKCLVYRYTSNSNETIAGQTGFIPVVKKILNNHNLIPEGEILRIVYQYSHEEGKRQQHAAFIVPLK